MTYTLGLLGKNIAYSFSRNYFQDKFKAEKITNITYENFDVERIDLLPSIIENTRGLKGLNVTIPYKEAVLPYLHCVDEIARAIGAVNTIKVTESKALVGYNTDCYGFKEALLPFLKYHHKKALILGTGGASKAVAYALKTLGIAYSKVSRTPCRGVQYTYSTLTEHIVKTHQIIINSTPLGTFPNTLEYPDIPYGGIDKNHLIFDLIYNPKETIFLKLGRENQATILNGLNMLKLQAEKSWAIWNTPLTQK